LSIFIAHNLRQGYALNKLEDGILAKAESASSELTGPNGLKDRINGILKFVESDRQQIAEYFRNIKPDLSEGEQGLLKQQLQSAQTQLEQIKEVVTYTSKALEVMESRKGEKPTN
jgi:chromosome segregation ATPase